MRNLWISHGIAALAFLLDFLRDPCAPDWRVAKDVTTQAALVITATDSVCQITVYNMDVVDAHEALCLPISVLAGSVTAAATRMFWGPTIMRRVPAHCLYYECDDDDDDNGNGSHERPLLGEGPPANDLDRHGRAQQPLVVETPAKEVDGSRRPDS